jgi:Resolvase, N terminal domain
MTTTTTTVTMAAIYLRQSLDRHGDELAVSRQREDCEKLCADRGWPWLEYVDNDTSASGHKPRPLISGCWPTSPLRGGVWLCGTTTFAERYPTEDEVATAVATFESWREVSHRG